jgi:hypothetical protein
MQKRDENEDKEKKRKPRLLANAAKLSEPSNVISNRAYMYNYCTPACMHGMYATTC